MKHLLLLICCTTMLTASITQEAYAQEKKESAYYYTDIDKNITYGVYLRVSGYQVEIFYNNSTAKTWVAAKVIYTSDDVIKYQIPYQNWQYEITIDSRNEDAIQIKNITTNGKTLRYFKKE